MAWKRQFMPLFGFLGHISPKKCHSSNRHNPKKDHPWVEPHHLSHNAWISAARFELDAGTRKKRTGQDKQKAKKGLYFTYLGRSPYSSDLCQKLCSRWPPRRNHVCQVSKWNFQGYYFTRGWIFHFPIDIWMGLATVQCYCAACDNCHGLKAPGNKNNGMPY